MSGSDPTAYAASIAAPAPAAAPVPAAVSAAVPVEATEAAPSPAPVAEAPAPAVAQPPSATTLLGEAPQPEAKPAPADTAPAETKVEPQTDEPAPVPTFDPFVLPEGVALQEDQLSNFTGLLAELETGGKVEHALAQEFGQKLIDLHLAESAKAIEAANKANVEWWNAEKSKWKDTTLADPEIGGNRIQTTVAAARSAIARFGGTPEQQAELHSIMEQSGYGNHPLVLGLLARAGQAAAVEGRPLAAARPPAPPANKVQSMYGKSMSR